MVSASGSSVADKLTELALPTTRPKPCSKSTPSSSLLLLGTVKTERAAEVSVPSRIPFSMVPNGLLGCLRHRFEVLARALECSAF